MPRVLVVSDDPHIFDEVEYGFPADVDVAVADDARVAWSHMRQEVPDVAIVDIHTGSAGGYGLARDMSQEPRLSKVPVLMLIERAQDDWLARQAGAVLIRVKPVSSTDLVREALAVMGATPKT
jgi:DNA-binding response OmpR family regulator